MLQAHRISCTRQGRNLLTDVSVSLAPGSLVALCGANGAGKSSLLKVLAGHWLPTSGQVTLAGKPLAHYTALDLALRRAVLPQETVMAFDLDVAEVVLLGRYPTHRGNPGASDLRAANHAMHLTDCAAFAQRRIGSLSGGERARVQLARVLAQVFTLDAELAFNRFLMLDEPAASLDLAHQYQLFALLQKLAQTHGLGILVTVHDLNLAARFADQVLVLKNGELRQAGSADRAFNPSTLLDNFAIDAQVWRHPMGSALIVPLGACVTLA